MTDERRFTREKLMNHAGAAINKIDLLGPEGTAHCTMDEIEAMATLIVLAGILPGFEPAAIGTERTER